MLPAIPPATWRTLNTTYNMEGTYITAGDLALHNQEMRGYAGAYGYGYGCEQKHRNALQGGSITALAVGSAALIGVLAVGWGLNSASKARLKAAENLAAGNSKAIDILANNHIIERQSRETWQNQHAPSMTQYVDVRTGAGAASTSNALALAEAMAINNNSGLNSAIGGCNFLRVARYSAPRPCGCDTCEG